MKTTEDFLKLASEQIGNVLELREPALAELLQTAYEAGLADAREADPRDCHELADIKNKLAGGL